MNDLTLKFYKLHPSVEFPTFGTTDSACFDLSYRSCGRAHVDAWDNTNAPVKRPINQDKAFTILPGDRVLVPVGFIMDIPTGYSVRFHPRSGLSLKRGLILGNSEAVIDSDYVEELFIMLTNTSTVKQLITEGERLAQAELVPKLEYRLQEVELRPGRKTDRVGGYGSTGTH